MIRPSLLVPRRAARVVPWVLAVVFTLVVGQAWAVAPEPPRVFLDTTLVAPTGTTITVSAGGDLQAALNAAQPGDVITLPEAKEAYVVGNVLRPGPVLLKNNNVTISQAIAMAGGTMPDSKKEQVRIIRQEADGKTKREIIVNLKAIDKQQAADVARGQRVGANDYVTKPFSHQQLTARVAAVLHRDTGDTPVDGQSDPAGDAQRAACAG